MIDKTIDFFITCLTIIPIVILGTFGIWWGIESIKRNCSNFNCCKKKLKK